MVTVLSEELANVIRANIIFLLESVSPCYPEPEVAAGKLHPSLNVTHFEFLVFLYAHTVHRTWV